MLESRRVSVPYDWVWYVDIAMRLRRSSLKEEYQSQLKAVCQRVHGPRELLFAKYLVAACVWVRDQIEDLYFIDRDSA